MFFLKAITAMAYTPGLDLFIACSSSVTTTWIRESSIAKPNIDSNNYVGQLSRPQRSTCNSFHFQSLEVEFLESCSSIAWNLRLTTAPTTKSTHRQCRKLIANGKPSASSTARYSTPMVAPSRQKSLVGM